MHFDLLKVVGFSGRTVTEESVAKYVNTRESPIFRKRAVLYGLNVARPFIRERGTAIVVEGYFDVMALHSAMVRIPFNFDIFLPMISCCMFVFAPPAQQCCCVYG